MKHTYTVKHGCSSVATRVGCDAVRKSADEVTEGSVYCSSDLSSKGLFNQILLNTVILDTQELFGEITK